MKKTMKKLLPLFLAVVMSLAFAGAALADTTGTITVNNAAKGETYAVYKVLDATINTNGGINYTGEIPAEFSEVLEATTVGTAPNTYSAIGIKSGATQDQINTALKAYAVRVSGAESYDKLVESKNFANANQQITANANSVSFNVAPGFYVVVSSQGTTVMADSATNPATAINEKNITEVTAEKTVDKESYSIGDTVKYTATFDTANYLKQSNAEEAQPVTEYIISDTLPSFLTNAQVTKVTIGGTEYKVDGAAPQFSEGSISIPWADYDTTTEAWTSKYNNGAQIVVEYTAVLTSTTNIGKNDTNTVSIQPKLGKNNGTSDEPSELKKEDDAEIKTYAAALKKTDGTNALAGAEFQIAGLVAHETENGSGIWIVDSYSSANNAPTTLKTDSNGKLYIVGIASDTTMKVTETKAPDGYNKLKGEKDLSPQLMETTSSKTTTWEKYDAKGNLIDSKTTETENYTQNTKSLADLDAAALQIVNKKGTELPSTGGIGTTIFYIAGSALVLVAGAALFARRVARKQS